MPVEPTAESAHEDRLYYELVQSQMIHVCSNAVNGCLDKNNNCKRGFKNREATTETTLDEKGYPKYKRPTERDFFVVSHNKQLLLEWEGHINVEYAGSSYSVLYLYKYLYKGNKKVKANFIDNTEGIQKDDEINLYLRGRLLSAMDVMWRLCGFHTYPASSPSVSSIKVKLPEQTELLHDDGKVCDMSVYFARPAPLAGLKYAEVFTKFTYARTLPERFKNGRILDETQFDRDDFTVDNFCMEITNKFQFLMVQRKHLYLYSRARREKRNIVRMGHLPPTAGEAFFLRILLDKLAAVSFVQLRTVEV